MQEVLPRRLFYFIFSLLMTQLSLQKLSIQEAIHFKIKVLESLKNFNTCCFTSEKIDSTLCVDQQAIRTWATLVRLIQADP